MSNQYKKWGDEQYKKWYKYNNAYSKKNYVTVTLKLSKTNDKDIIDHFYDENGKTKCQVSKEIKEMIRKQIRGS